MFLLSQNTYFHNPHSSFYFLHPGDGIYSNVNTMLKQKVESGQIRFCVTYKDLTPLLVKYPLLVSVGRFHVMMNGSLFPRACIKSLTPTLNQCHLPLLRGRPGMEYKSATSNISQSHSVLNSDISDHCP